METENKMTEALVDVLDKPEGLDKLAAAVRAKARELGDKRGELGDGAETALVLKMLKEALEKELPSQHDPTEEGTPGLGGTLPSEPEPEPGAEPEPEPEPEPKKTV